MSANKNYTVVVAGMGKRGTHHADAFQKNGRFKLVGLCDIDAGRLETAAKKFGVSEISADATALVKKTQPDIFCFCTLPNLRLPLDSCRRGSGRKAYRLRKAHGAFHQRSAGDDEAHARGGCEDRGQPPAPLRRALQESEGDYRQRRHRPRAHRLRHAPPAG